MKLTPYILIAGFIVGAVGGGVGSSLACLLGYDSFAFFFGMIFAIIGLSIFLLSQFREKTN